MVLKNRIDHRLDRRAGHCQHLGPVVLCVRRKGEAVLPVHGEGETGGKAARDGLAGDSHRRLLRIGGTGGFLVGFPLQPGQLVLVRGGLGLLIFHPALQVLKGDLQGQGFGVLLALGHCQGHGGNPLALPLIEGVHALHSGRFPIDGSGDSSLAVIPHVHAGVGCQLLLDQRPKILWVAPHGLFHQAPLAFVHGSQLLFPFSAC